MALLQLRQMHEDSLRRPTMMELERRERKALAAGDTRAAFASRLQRLQRLRAAARGELDEEPLR